MRTSSPFVPSLDSPAAYGRLVRLPKLNKPTFKFNESVVNPVALVFKFSPEVFNAFLYKLR